MNTRNNFQRTTRLQDDDEAVAREFQEDEDERIARKLQNDYEMGLDPSSWKLYQSRPQTMANRHMHTDDDDHFGVDRGLTRDIDDFTRHGGDRDDDYGTNDLDFASKDSSQASPIIQSRTLDLYDGASTPQSDDFHAFQGQKKSKPPNAPSPAAVTSAMQQLSAYVSSYHPETIELEAVLKPFIPEYLPAIGDIDPMLKIPMPKADAQQEHTHNLDFTTAPQLGITVLDEPHIKQSDPAALSLQLRALQKSSQTTNAMASIKSIDVPIATPTGKKLLQSWVNSVQQMHIKPSEVVTYSKRMPDIEELMQRFPSRLINLLVDKESMNIGDLDLDLKEVSQLCLALLDVPIHPSKTTDAGKRQRAKTRQLIESLHVLFSLYLEFDEHGHFGRLQ